MRPEMPPPSPTSGRSEARVRHDASTESSASVGEPDHLRVLSGAMSNVLLNTSSIESSNRPPAML